MIHLNVWNFAVDDSYFFKEKKKSIEYGGERIKVDS